MGDIRKKTITLDEMALNKITYMGQYNNFVVKSTWLRKYILFSIVRELN